MVRYISRKGTIHVPFEIVSARSDERRTVRVTFSDTPKVGNSSLSDDATNPDNWSIQPWLATYVPGEFDYEKAYTTVEIERINIVDGDPYSIDIVVDVDFTFGIDYTLLNIGNISRSNETDGWTNNYISAIVFRGYDPGCRLRTVPNIWDWFGDGAKALDQHGDGEKLTQIWQDVFEQMKSLIDCMREIFDPRYCPREFLLSRMEALGNPFYDLIRGMTTTELRRVALQLVPVYKSKGTTRGMKLAIQEILGLTVYVNFFNENTWTLHGTGKTFTNEVTGNNFFLGGGRYVPDESVYGAGNYPTYPLDEHYTPNEQYTGTCMLGPGLPQYIHAILGDDVETRDKTHTARLDGQWHLSDSSVPAMPLQPDLNVDESTIVQEPFRRGYHSFRIVAEQALTAEERRRIAILANYMKPAQTHLFEIRETPDTYNPMVLDQSALDQDWILH